MFSGLFQRLFKGIPAKLQNSLMKNDGLVLTVSNRVQFEEEIKQLTFPKT